MFKFACIFLAGEASRKNRELRIMLEVQGRLNVVKEAVEPTVSDAIVKPVKGVVMVEEAGKKAASHAARLAEILQRISSAVILTDAEGKIEWINKGFTLLCGYTLQEVVGKKPGQILQGPKTNVATVARMRDAIRRGEGVTVEVVNYAKDNREYVVRIEITPLRDTSSAVTGFIAIENDITLQKRTEESILRSEAKFRTLFDSSTDAVMLLDEAGFFDCNTATLQIMGSGSREDFCSKHPSNYSPPEQPCGTDSFTLAQEKIAAAMTTGSQRFEWMHQRADTGATFPAEVLLSGMQLDGRPVIQAVVRDISDRRRSEEALATAMAAAETALRESEALYIYARQTRDRVSDRRQGPYHPDQRAVLPVQWLLA